MTTMSVPEPAGRGSDPAGQEGLLVRLLAALEEMTQLQQQLLSVLQREKSLVIEGDLDLLLSCLAEKESVLSRLDRLERERQEIMGPLAESLNRDASSLSLRQLIAFVREPYASRLASCHQRLEALSGSIAELNRINGLLIEKTLGQISSLLGLLRHLSLASPIYQATGLASEQPLGGRVLGKG